MKNSITQSLTKLKIVSIDFWVNEQNIASYSKIMDISLFIDSHLSTIKANKGKRTFLPYLNRLQELKQVLTTNSYAVKFQT
jgi:hypothetical protein